MRQLCEVCRKGSPELYSAEKWELGDSTYRLVACPVCHCAFTDPLPDDATVKAHYEGSFDYQWYRDHYAAKVRDCRIRVQEYGDILGGRVLDFGGGLGYFSYVARENGLESVTFDPYTANDKPQRGEWDCVVALHVLEHSNQPDNTIEQMKSMLRAGGKLILAVPNFAGRGYREQGMKWVWAQPPLTHIFHFTAEGLRTMLGRHGFDVVTVSYHERWDANLVCDVEKVSRFRRMDCDWARKPYNSFAPLRRLIAYRNSRARFRALEAAQAHVLRNSDVYSELQTVAYLGRQSTL